MKNALVKQNQKEQIIDLLKLEKTGGNISLVCKLIGISRQTLYDWRKEDLDFSRAIDFASIEGKIAIADLAEQGLIDRIKAGDTTAIIFTLKNLRKKFYLVGNDLEVNQVQEKREGNPKTPSELLLWLSMLLQHQKYIAQSANILDDDLSRLFIEMNNLINKYKSMYH